MSHDSHHEKISDTCNAAVGSDYCEPGGPCEVDCVDGCVDKSTAEIPHTGFGDCGCADCWPADPIGCDESSDAAISLERDLLEELGKAAATFSDLRVALELLRHDSLAMACGVAEEHIREVIKEANRVRYTR